MGLRLKRIEEQTIVITGASSGIGLVTARMAASRGARVMLAARNEAALARAVDDIVARGGRAAYAVTDVSDERAVERLADAAVREFGGFDTWVNDASVAIYGTTLQVSTEDMRRLFDVNFWGLVHGSRVAVEHLKERFADRAATGGYAGAIVNVGSTLSDRVVPLLGVYAASKHAVKAFTDALRMDLEEEHAPISVSLVKPACIDTPFYDNSRNYLAHAPQPTPPVYAPEVAAEAILGCAERPLRDVFAGGGAKAMSAFGYYAPGLADSALRVMYETQQSDRPAGDAEGNLYRPLDGGARGRYRGKVLESSAYTSATLHPAATVVAALGIGAALVAGSRLLGSRHTRTAESATGDEGAERRSGDAPDAPVEREVHLDSGGVADSAESAQYAPGGMGGAETPRTDVDRQ
jgi:short-subunit dehydrogenase